jgi:Protein of unknown function (DUF3800)
MKIQAFIDDSSTNSKEADRVFLLGGVVAREHRWDEFSKAWQAELSKPPKLEYFKLSEALSMKKQFLPENGWTEESRVLKLIEPAHIVDVYADKYISVSLDLNRYNELVAPFAVAKVQRDPYFYCFYGVVDLISQYLHELPNVRELECIFDEQGETGRRALARWDELEPEIFAATKYHRAKPVMKDDKMTAPLQAADLFAGLMRGTIEGNLDVQSIKETVFKKFNPAKGSFCIVGKDELMRATANLIIKKSGIYG